MQAASIIFQCSHYNSISITWSSFYNTLSFYLLLSSYLLSLFSPFFLLTFNIHLLNYSLNVYFSLTKHITWSHNCNSQYIAIWLYIPFAEWADCYARIRDSVNIKRIKRTNNVMSALPMRPCRAIRHAPSDFKRRPIRSQRTWHDLLWEWTWTTTGSYGGRGPSYATPLAREVSATITRTMTSAREFGIIKAVFQRRERRVNGPIAWPFLSHNFGPGLQWNFEAVKNQPIDTRVFSSRSTAIGRLNSIDFGLSDKTSSLTWETLGSLKGLYISRVGISNVDGDSSLPADACKHTALGSVGEVGDSRISGVHVIRSAS